MIDLCLRYWDHVHIWYVDDCDEKVSIIYIEINYLGSQKDHPE